MTKADLRTRLVQEAMRMLAEGTEEVTLRAVARAAGVSAMAPYRHFADKAALLGAVKGEGFARLRLLLIEADRAETDCAALIRQGLAYRGFALAHPALFRLMFAAPEMAAYEPNPEDDTAYGVLARRVARIVPPQARATATTAAWSIVHGLATLTLDGRLRGDEEQARAVLGLFVAGLAG